MRQDSQNLEARWTLTLLAILKNRPKEADIQLASLEILELDNPWPSAYRIIINLIDFKPWKAFELSKIAKRKYDNDLFKALYNISGSFSGRIWLFSSLNNSIDNAIEYVERKLEEGKL